MSDGVFMTFDVSPDWRAHARKTMEDNDLSGSLVFFVRVRNMGRAPITVQNCGFVTSTGERVGTIGRPHWGPKFSARIEAHGQEIFGYDADAITEMINNFKSLQKAAQVCINARVDLGTGKHVDSKTALRL